MHSSNDGSKYTPDEGFLQDMADRRDETGHECEYVPSGYSTPDYRILNSEQREYYFYWRSQLAKGNCLHTDDGYVWLRLCEIVNLPYDYDSASAELQLMHRGCGYLRIRDLIKSVIIDYALANDRDIPRVWVWGWDSRRFMALSEVMASPPDRMELDFMVRLAGNPEVYWEEPGILERLMNQTVLRIDTLMIDGKGVGLAETFGREVRIDHKIYSGLYYAGDDADFSISYTDLDKADFKRFMLGLLRYCEQILFKNEGIRGPSAPSAFDNSMRAVANGALKDILDGEPDDTRGPKFSRGTERTRISAKERMLIEMGKEFGIEDPFDGTNEPTGRNGRMEVDLETRVRPVSRTLRFDIDMNKDARPEFDYPYVSSGYQNPDYRSFDDGQRGFYLSWREKVRSGEYPDTDSGYVWLYLCELINSDSDPYEVLRAIGDLGTAYEDHDSSRPLIRSTYYEYAAVNGLTDVDPSIYRSPVTMSMAFSSLLDGTVDRIDDIYTLIEMSNLREGSMRDDFDSDCAVILCRTIRRIDASITGYDGIMGKTMVYPKNVKVRPFTRLKYYRKDIPSCGVNVEYWDFRGSEMFVKDMNAVTKNVIRAVRRRRGKKTPMQKGKCFGIECTGIIESETDAWFSRSELRPPKPRPRQINIDMDAVREAESDLNRVTELMKVDEEEETVPEEEPVPISQDSDDPWIDFMESLTEEESAYLESALEGTPMKGRKASKLEDSINSKASDTVGDVVMEDGTVFGDYEEDIRRCME